ncbi:MAG: thioesterase family protein [Haloechinothrix sp.]
MTSPVPEHPAFYTVHGDDVFESSSATESPWDEKLQHGGPPAALLARAVERVRPDPAMQIARITVDILGGIPQGTIRTEAAIVRPGKRIELIEARLWANDRLAVTATAWRIRTNPDSTRAQVRDGGRSRNAVSVPAEQPHRYPSGVSPEWGYGRAIDWRPIDGGFDELGPARVWTRLRIPLVAGEDSSPIQRLLVVADSTNGLSSELPLSEWLFIPPTMTATIQRPPESEWMLLDARTTIGSDGLGMAQSEMYDAHGLTAAVTQPLVVAPRT